MPGKQILTIEWLRAIAAMCVMVFHTSQGIEFRTGIKTTDWTDFGASGVDIFFVISGFIMTVTTENRRFVTSDFLLKRAIRILPIYWILTLLKAVSLVVVPSLVLFSVFSVPNIVTSLLLVPYVTPGRGLIPLIIVAWSLEIEVMFYLVFAGCKAMLGKNWALGLTATFVIFNLFTLATSLDLYVLDFYARPIIFEFLYGIAIGLMFVRRRLPSRPVAIALVVFGFLGLFTLPQGTELTRFLVWGVPSAMIVLGMVALEQATSLWSWRPMIYVGNSSYSLYLTHTMAVPFIMLPLRYLHLGPVGGFLYLIPMIVVQVGIGCLAYALVEKPVTSMLQRRYVQWRSARMAQSAA